MAVFNEPTQWTHPLGNNADVSTLPDDTPGTTGKASLQKLFQLINQTPLEAGGIAPEREDFNALFKVLGDYIYYNMNGGVAGYNSLFDYPAGRIVIHTDGYIYRSLGLNGPNTPAGVVTPGTDTTIWAKLVNENDIANIRTPIGMSVEWNADWLPDNGLWENGAEYDEADYTDLFTVIGYRYGSTTATKASCSLGEAFIAGAAGNNIRITVAASGASFLVSTYVSSELKNQQLVTAATELKNTDYVTWDTSVTLADGTDVTMTGGADGTSFKVPNKTGRYSRTADGTYPLGTEIAEQLPNITGGSAGYGGSAGTVFTHGSTWNNGAFSFSSTNNMGTAGSYNGIGNFTFNAHNSNSTYTDNGKVLPLSISKQSYIIYK